MAKPQYATPAYRHARAALLADSPMCVHCRCRVATSADHQPPIALHAHIGEGMGCCKLVPSCLPCAQRQGQAMLGAKGRAAILARRVTSPRPSAGVPAAAASPTAEPAGYPADDPIWDVPWLSGLCRVPADAAWPRLMTPPHPSAVGSYGADLAAYAEARTGRPLRWWQRLYAARALEHDADGLLCWDACDLTVARQVGKSYLLREACLWRMHQGDRWDVQTIVHTGKDLPVCVEIQRPARRWARGDRFADVYKVRDANGQEQIELLADGSRWLVKAKDSVYGLTASMAVVDEAWAVPATIIEEGLVPTMVELAASQLWLVSTAHRKATALMVNRRNAMAANLDDTAGDLWVEWSAPTGADPGDEAGWRAASPQWSDRRRRMITQRLTAARSGDSDDPDEPDPMEAFSAQWLNRWPTVRRRTGRAEPLLGEGVWHACTGALDTVAGAGVVALEHNRGQGAAVAFVGADGAGRFEVDGRERDTWPEAIALARSYIDANPGARLVVGADIAPQLPPDFPGRRHATLGGSATGTARGLVVLRALAAERRIVHEHTPALDAQLSAARVYNRPGGGLGLVNNGARADLLRAALWALDAAQITPPTPAVR